MAELSTLARPYAKAAFDYANEHGVVEQWEQFLVLAGHIVTDPQFATMLDNPAISSQQKADVLLDLYDQQIKNTDESWLQSLLGKLLQNAPSVSNNIKNFVYQLSEQRRLGLMPVILTHFRTQKAKALKHIDAYITTAYPLTDIQRALVQARLATSMNATIIMHEAVDPSLIAGATIKVGDKLVDDSVRGKLKQLRTQLTA